MKRKSKDPFAGMDIPWESLDEYKNPGEILEALKEARKEIARYKRAAQCK